YKIYVMPDGATNSQAREFTTEGFASFELGWTTNSQLVISLIRGNVVLLDPNSAAKTQLLSQARFPGFARSCPDGHIVFAALPESKIESHIFRADADGGNVKELTHGKFDFLPVCSSDSRTVLFADADSKLEKVSIEGGSSQQFPDYAIFGRTTISPDG